jgi:hypothetical protein
MMMRSGLFIILFALAALLSGDGAPASPPTRARTSVERIRFHIVTVEEDGRARKVISESVVDGPPNTDFNINLEDKRFRMKADFLTDLIRPDALKLRVRLETRRLYGYSERNLPLYEEDSQAQTLELGFDEEVILLPFGRNGGDNRLKIEIRPELDAQGESLPSGKKRPLEINILKQSPGGVVSIQASKIPHRFTVEATLLEDGREVARGTSDYLIDEAQEFSLKPTEEASAEVVNNPLTVNLTINQFARSRPQDEATIVFDLLRTNEREPLAHNWSGVSPLGSTMTYNVSDVYLRGTGRKYELRFKVNLAPGESGD